MVMKKNSKDALTAAEIKEIKKHLEELKADAEKRLKDKKNMDMPENEVGDPIDVASQSLDKEILFELSGNSHNTIGQIEAALRKIEKGIYGRCELCRQPIPKKRIKALPFARYCVNCQHSSERNNG
ncbi:TraR/DksA family transcriptional regulator [Candidatus Avelusimicrobium facis]|uniref:TraR/DksA family transcriptional regulator n=2 Tax=Candidatus Avelusimicrobium facis TaxID=3416203 RepID=UPI003D10C9BA